MIDYLLYVSLTDNRNQLFILFENIHLFDSVSVKIYSSFLFLEGVSTKYFFLITQPKHMVLVLKRTISL